MPTDWTEALYLETRVAQIISQQEQNGWLFDSELAKQHVNTLDEITDELYDKIAQGFGYVKDTKKRTCAKPFNKEGGYSKKVLEFFSKNGEELPVSGPFTFIRGFL